MRSADRSARNSSSTGRRPARTDGSSAPVRSSLPTEAPAGTGGRVLDRDTQAEQPVPDRIGALERLLFTSLLSKLDQVLDETTYQFAVGRDARESESEDVGHR